MNSDKYNEWIRMNSDKYSEHRFANVYPVIYFDIFGDSFVSDCKQTFREYELESYVFV